jgi:hypothetical protein
VATPPRWLSVPQYESTYEVSDLGRVRSLDRVVVCRNRIGFGFHERRYPTRLLKVSPDDNGYPRVSLTVSGRVQRRHVHRLVLGVFVGPAPEGHEGCHRDGNPENNRLDNLYWGTPSENQYDKVRHGRHHNQVKTVCKYGHPLVAPNLKSNTPKGTRYCLACNRASGLRSSAKKNDSPVPDHQTLSNICLQKILQGSAL